MLAKNMGGADRVIRLIIGVALLAFFFLMPDHPWRFVGLIGIVPIVTALVGICPLYSIFGLSTCPAKPLPRM